MRQSWLAFFLLSGAAAGWAAPQVTAYMMTKPDPGDCTKLASLPPAYTSFPSTDTAAWLYFEATNNAAGDVWETDYYTPSGAFYAPMSGAWDPIPSSGNYCFVDWAFEIAGAPPATMPGTWTVKALVNGQLMFTLTFSIVQQTPACSYSLTPTSDSVPASGGSKSVHVTTPSGCAWNAGSNASWITINSGGSGSGPGDVAYSASANTSATQRSGTMTIAGLTFTLTQAGSTSPPPPAGKPTIQSGGIYNAASMRALNLARGGFFAIKGTGLGPVVAQTATQFPLQDNMAGVVVTATQGGLSKRAYLHYISATQINAILPSDTPLGANAITVAYNGVASDPQTVTVVKNQIGIFTVLGGVGPGVIQNYVSGTSAPLNTQTTTARPGQIVIVWGTGLGPTSTPDYMPNPGGNMPMQFTAVVGGKTASIQYGGRAPSYAGVDNIYLTIPADAPSGCSVPLQVQADGVWSNEVRLAIDANGQHCTDTLNPFAGMTSTGGSVGVLGLIRAELTGQIEAGQPPIDVTLDLGAAAFGQITAGGDLSYSPLLNLPPVGTCASTQTALDLSSALGNPLSLLGFSNFNGKQLDAGAKLTVTGTKGTQDLPQTDPAANPGVYLGLIGGTDALGLSNLPLFLDPGAYTIKGTGGKDVGAINASLNMPGPVTMVNPASLDVVTKSAGITLNWTGGTSSQVLLILGGAADGTTGAFGGFFCFASASAGTFKIPAYTLADVPATGSSSSLSSSIGALMILSLPSTPQKFSATGIDTGLGLTGQAYLRIVQFK